jgi:Fe-S oxidoreductase
MSYIDCCDWSKCTICGECLMKCPVLEMGEEEAKSEFKRLLDGQPTQRVLQECTLCYRCNALCPEELRPYELILQRVSEQENHRDRVPAMVQYMLNGMPPPTFFQDLYESLSFAEKEILRRWDKTPPPCDEILFVGCIGKNLCYSIDNSEVLKSLPKFGPTDVCCGEIHYRSGMWDAYVDIVERTLERFSELDIKRMVCYCGSCYYFLSNVLPNVYGKKLPFELISLYQWLLEKVRKGELEVKRPLNRKVAVHESCYVNVLEPQFCDDLREIYRIAGAELVELEHNRERGLSCGFASIARDWNLLDAIKAQLKKYKEIKDTGVKEVALNCPGCYMNMFTTSWMQGVKLRYMPDELLRAFGDDVSVPLSKIMPRVVKSFTVRSPLALMKEDVPLPRMQK